MSFEAEIEIDKLINEFLGPDPVSVWWDQEHGDWKMKLIKQKEEKEKEKTNGKAEKLHLQSL